MANKWRNYTQRDLLKIQLYTSTTPSSNIYKQALRVYIHVFEVNYTFCLCSTTVQLIFFVKKENCHPHIFYALRINMSPCVTLQFLLIAIMVAHMCAVAAPTFFFAYRRSRRARVFNGLGQWIRVNHHNGIFVIQHLLVSYIRSTPSLFYRFLHIASPPRRAQYKKIMRQMYTNND